MTIEYNFGDNLEPSRTHELSVELIEVNSIMTFERQNFFIRNLE